MADDRTCSPLLGCPGVVSTFDSGEPMFYFCAMGPSGAAGFNGYPCRPYVEIGVRTHINGAPVAISAALSADAEIDAAIDRLKDELETVRRDAKAMLCPQRERHAIGIAVPRLIGGTRSNSD